MIANNLKVLRAYLLGIILSLFLSFPFGWLFEISPHAFSVLTGIISFALMYRVTWNFGRKDSENKNVSILKVLMSISAFVLISVIFLICHAVCGDSTPGLINHTGMIWFYPFTGFYSSSPAVIVAVVAVISVGFSIISYIMGVKNISLFEKSGLKDKFQMLLKKKK